MAMHSGHRRRLKDRFEKEGLDNFEQHQVLELLLFYCVPRVDTNPIAHALLDRFGSLKGVLDADQSELVTVKGIGPESAILIKLLPEYLRRYLSDDSEKVYRYDTIGKIGQYFYRKFIGVKHEQLYMMMFNNRMNLIDCVKISEGVVNASGVSMRKIGECIFHNNASSVLFAHNHPDGLAIPSSDDMATNSRLVSFLGDINVVQLEHIIFAGNRFCCMMKSQNGLYRTSPISQKIDTCFYEHFYDRDEEHSIVMPKLPTQS